MAKKADSKKPRAQTWDFQIFRVPRPAKSCDVDKCTYDLAIGPAEWGAFHRYRNPGAKEGFRTKIYCPNHAKSFAENHQLNEYSDGRPLGHCDEVNPERAPAVHSLNELLDQALAVRIQLQKTVAANLEKAERDKLNEDLENSRPPEGEADS